MEKLHSTRHETRKNRTGIIGIILILAGLVLIGDQFDLFSFRFREILFTWQGLLIVLGLLFLTKREGRWTGIILLFIGGFFLLPRFMVLPVSTLSLFWPVLLVVLGILILFKVGFNRGFGISASNTDGDIIEDVNVFGGSEYYEDHLAKDEFVRVHRSCLIQPSQISKLEPYEKNAWVIILKTGQKVPVSRSDYTLLKKVLDI